MTAAAEARRPAPGLLATGAAPIPVVVLTGFLGSGKTTVLRRLLTRPGLAETAVIVNELGAVGLDHLLLDVCADDVVLLENGCLCCASRNDLVAAMRGLLHRSLRGELPPFRRLVVETSGLADPAPVLQTLMRDPLRFSRYRPAALVATVDARLGPATLDRHPEARKQAAMADRLLLTKADVVESHDVAALAARLDALNPGAPLRTIAHGEVAADWLLAPAERAGGVAAGPSKGDIRHDRDAAIRTFAAVRDRPLAWAEFGAWLERIVACYGEGLLRVKGVLDIRGEDRPVVVQGVQHVFAPPERLTRWPAGPRLSRLVFIARDIDGPAFERALAELGPASATNARGRQP